MYEENPDGITWRVKKVLAVALGGVEAKRWTGDTAWLKDPTLPQTPLIVPFKGTRLEAVFAKAE